MSVDTLCFFNGIDGSSGDYLTPPLSTSELAAIARGEKIDPQLQRDLRSRYEASTTATFGPVAGIDTSDLSETGWGVVFAHNVDPAIREATSQLLELRRGQATLKKATRYREFIGPSGVRPNESAQAFLARHRVDSTQPADPDRGVPYYLLIVGSPDQISFRFQYQLDVQYAVGRIAFDTLDEYESYARSVVAAEMKRIRVPRRAVLFGVQNQGDRATALSRTQLIDPLASQLPLKLLEDAQPTWQIETVVAEQATKRRLGEILGGVDTPSLLFTASHGMGFHIGDPKQIPHQGALLCQDWPGRQAWNGPISHDHYFAGDDVADDASLSGLIAFHFACYGAGTPDRDDFSKQAYSKPEPIAPYPFLSRLPCRLLGHPRGGALAVIGHVERAWGCSFTWNQLTSQTQSFESALIQLMRGERIGTALDFFNLRFAALATELTNYLNDLEFGAEANSAYLASIWTAHNDARSYMVVGDPAVRLPLIETGEDPIRPSLIADVRIPSASTPSDLARSGVAAKVEDPPSDSVSHPSVQPLRFGSAITVPVPEPRLSETTSSSDRFLTSSGLESVSGTDLGYYLLAFDPVGRERTDSPAGLISNQILMALQKEPITDVIIFSHGWRGDVPAAREQYQGWLKTMAGCGADRIAIGQRRSAFRPLLIGVHWPSEPWGDERLDTSFSFVTDDETAAAHWVDEYAQALGDTPRIRAAIESVLAAVENAEVDGGDSAGGLPSELLAAYKDLDIAVGLPKQGIAGAPGADWDRFDPEVIFQIFRDEPVGADVESFGIGSKLRDSLLAPLRMMSFWKMKDRARLIGEQSVNPLLAKMQRAVGTRDVRFHLAGHSFGCIVASAAVAGLPGTAPLPRPIDSLSLLQGALSLWAYCSKQPYGSGEPGYFHRIISQGVIRGPIVTSQSDYDTAVRVLYPRAAQVAGHVAFAPVGLPKYGAIGTFGIQGPGLNISNVKMLPVDQNYPLHGGQIYNVDGTSYINQGGGLSGAHSDIRRPEVAHLVWQAILPE